MKSTKTRLELLAELSARMRYTPTLFDEACARAAETIQEASPETLAALAGPVRLRRDEVEVLLTVFPPGKPSAPDGPSQE
jgi:hypothetical protein